jgi:hypothetical protein
MRCVLLPTTPHAHVQKIVCVVNCFLSEFSENQNEKEKREKEGKRLI